MTEPRRIVVNRDDLRAVVMPELRERVFHVTTRLAYKSILETGAVIAVPPENSSAKKWSYDSYFRSIGCVSLCDLRGVEDEKIDVALDAYWFLDPRHGDADPVFLILSPEAVESVLGYEEALTRGALKKMIVPYIEAGFPGDLQLSLLEDVIVVEIVRPPPDPHLEALRARGGWK